jgi:hypothetical protein
VGVAADCAVAANGEQNNSNSADAKNDRTFILIIPFADLQVASERLSDFSLVTKLPQPVRVRRAEKVSKTVPETVTSDK